MEITAQVAAANAQAARQQAEVARQQKQAELLQTPKVQKKIKELENLIDKVSKDGKNHCYQLVNANANADSSTKVKTIIGLVFVFVVLPTLFAWRSQNLIPFVSSGAAFLLGYLLLKATTKNGFTKDELKCVADELSKKGFHTDIDCFPKKPIYKISIDWSNSGSQNE